MRTEFDAPSKKKSLEIIKRTEEANTKMELLHWIVLVNIFVTFVLCLVFIYCCSSCCHSRWYWLLELLPWTHHAFTSGLCRSQVDFPIDFSHWWFVVRSHSSEMFNYDIKMSLLVECCRRIPLVFFKHAHISQSLFVQNCETTNKCDDVGNGNSSNNSSTDQMRTLVR